jgi:hypothetical protein
MTVYIKLSTLEYPRYEGDIRLEHPEILETQTGNTFPCPETYALVYHAPMPDYNRDTEALEETAPKCINNEWFQTWQVRALTAEELQERADRLAKQEL